MQEINPETWRPQTDTFHFLDKNVLLQVDKVEKKLETADALS